MRLARTTGQAATVHLGWLPGGEEPDRLSARLGDGTILDFGAIARAISVPDLTLAGSALDLELASVPWRTSVTRGYMGGNWRWDS